MPTDGAYHSVPGDITSNTSTHSTLPRNVTRDLTSNYALPGDLASYTPRRSFNGGWPHGAEEVMGVDLGSR